MATDRHVTPPELKRYVSERLLVLPGSFFLTDHAGSFPRGGAGAGAGGECGVNSAVRRLCFFSSPGKISRRDLRAARGIFDDGGEFSSTCPHLTPHPQQSQWGRAIG
eukprot:761578-Hanusia_phi.AAC.1